jgi:hypothetical protein
MAKGRKRHQSSIKSTDVSVSDPSQKRTRRRYCYSYMKHESQKRKTWREGRSPFSVPDVSPWDTTCVFCLPFLVSVLHFLLFLSLGCIGCSDSQGTRLREILYQTYKVWIFLRNVDLTTTCAHVDNRVGLILLPHFIAHFVACCVFVTEMGIFLRWVPLSSLWLKFLPGPHCSHQVIGEKNADHGCISTEVEGKVLQVTPFQ